MTKETQRAYSLGYGRGLAAGFRNRKRTWPDWLPPHPPVEEVRDLFEAAQNLNEAAAALLSAIIADEPLSQELERRQKEMDDAFSMVTRWIERQVADAALSAKSEGGGR